MRIGVFGQQWWTPACAALGHEAVPLPMPLEPPADKHHADAAARLATGERGLERLRDERVDFLLDDAGSGLQFVSVGGGADTAGGGETTADSGAAAARRVALLHERLGVPLVSHFIDPMPTALQALPPMQRWQALQSRSWIKLVFDRAHAYELRSFGVPNVLHMPIGAVDRAYDTRPIDPGQFGSAISFAGSQLGTYFYPGRQHEARSQLPGLVALAVRATKPDTVFFDVYHGLYGFAEGPRAGEPVADRVAKMEQYYAARIFYNAALWIAQRDRFVLFLRRALPDAFRLVGRNWNEAYGLSAEPPIDSYDQFLDAHRRAMINVNLVSGNAETGVNMRTFEITAAGGFMLHQWRPELAECFEIGQECDAFRDEEELLAKCRYYLSNPQRVVEIAAAGQRRTLRQHLFSHRLAALLPLVKQVTASTGSSGAGGRPAQAPPGESRFVAAR
jgi:spore maturation protein CgeB